MDMLSKISIENLYRALKFLRYKAGFFQMMINLQKAGVTIDMLQEHIIIRDTNYKINSLSVMLADFPIELQKIIPTIIRVINTNSINDKISIIKNIVKTEDNVVEFSVKTDIITNKIQQIYILINDEHLLTNYSSVQNADIFYNKFRELFGLESITDYDLLLDFLILLCTNIRNDQWFLELSIDKISVLQYNFIELIPHNFTI
jgi:hypothetical protein